MKAGKKLRERLNNFIKDRKVIGLSASSTPTDGTAVPKTNQRSISLNESTFRCCNDLPLTMFEKYVIGGDLQGMSAEHWEKLYSEYNTLTGDSSVASMILNIGKYNALTSKINRVNTLLFAIAECYDNGVQDDIDITPIIKSVKAEFRQAVLTFSKETYKKDIELCNNLLKSSLLQHKQLEQILEQQKGNGESGTTYFDDVLIMYSKVNKSPLIIKSSINTQTFARIVKDLKNASRPN